jgi:tetratricopeptide (TPR) repeat protein
MSSLSDAIRNLEDRELSDAKTLFNKAIAERNFPSIAHAGLAICYALENNDATARDELKESEKLGKLGVLGCIAYGLILNKEGKAREAEGYFAQATKLDPNSSFAHLMNGSFLLSYDRVEDAIISLLQAKEVGGNRWVLNRNLAIAYLRNEKYPRALREAALALVLRPSVEGIELIFMSFFRAFPVVLFIIYGTGVYFFFTSPRSTQGITVLTATLIVVEFIRYLMDRKKQRLRFILFILVLGLMYYFAYVK